MSIRERTRARALDGPGIRAGALWTGASRALVLNSIARSALAFMIVGGAPLHAPLFGGTRVPVPTLPPGLPFYMQAWMLGGSPSGFSATNGLLAVTQ